MNKPATKDAYYRQFRTAEEIAADEENDIHQAGDCNWATCRLCQEQALAEEIDGMAEHVNRELDNEERCCPRCGSADFLYWGDRQRCAVCNE